MLVQPRYINASFLKIAIFPPLYFVWGQIFRSTESLAICEDIKNAIKVLSGLLDVLYLQLVAAKNLQNESNLQDLSELQSMKISKVGQLEKLSVGNEGKHSILDDDTKEDGDISENSFEDLRA